MWIKIFLQLYLHSPKEYVLIREELKRANEEIRDLWSKLEKMQEIEKELRI